jgi:hypothetical protein
VRKYQALYHSNFRRRAPWAGNSSYLMSWGDCRTFNKSQKKCMVGLTRDPIWWPPLTKTKGTMCGWVNLRSLLAISFNQNKKYMCSSWWQGSNLLLLWEFHNSRVLLTLQGSPLAGLIFSFLWDFPNGRVRLIFFSFKGQNCDSLLLSTQWFFLCPQSYWISLRIFPVIIQKYMCNALRLDDMHTFLPGLKYRSPPL